MSGQWFNQGCHQQGPPGPQFNFTTSWAQNLQSPVDAQPSVYVISSTQTATSSTHTSNASDIAAQAQQSALSPPSVSSSQVQHAQLPAPATQQLLQSRQAEQTKAAEEAKIHRERDQEERQRQQAKRQAPQQQLQQAPLPQQTPLGFQNTTSNITARATSTSQMVMQEGLSAESGQHRRQAIQEGADSVQRFDQRIQVALRSLGICPRAYYWYPTSDGFLCGGGNHFFPDTEIDKLLNVPYYMPRVKAVNCPRMSMFGQHGGFEPLKKPPASMPRHETAWIEYQMAQMAARNMNTVARMYFRSRGYNI